MKQFQKLSGQDSGSVTIGIQQNQFDIGNNWQRVYERDWGLFTYSEGGFDLHHFNPFQYKNLKELILELNEYFKVDFPWYTYGRDWCFVKPSYYLTVLGLPLESLSKKFEWIPFIEHASVDHIFGKPDLFHNETTWFICREVPSSRFGVMDTVSDRLDQVFYTHNQGTKGALAAPVSRVVTIDEFNPYTTRDKVVVSPMQTTMAIGENSLSAKLLGGDVSDGMVLELAQL